MREKSIWFSTLSVLVIALFSGCASESANDEQSSTEAEHTGQTTKPAVAPKETNEGIAQANRANPDAPKLHDTDGQENKTPEINPIEAPAPAKADPDSSTKVAAKTNTPKKPPATPEQPAAPEVVRPMPVSIGFPATEIVAKDVDGVTVNLSSYRGKIVLIDFWATWCGPCIVELPNVKEVYAKHGSKNFDILGVSLDTDKDKLQQFVAANDMPWRQIFDGKGWKNTTAQLYAVKSIPRMYLIDEEGIVRYQNVRGQALHDAVDDLVEKGLARLAILAQSEDQNVKSLAAFRMGKYGAPNAKETLTVLTKDPLKLVQQRAAVGLALLDDSSGALLPQIREAVKDESAEVRAASLSVLGRAKDSKLLALASNALDDEAIEVRRAAVSALGDLNDPKATNVLVNAVDDSDTFVAKTAIKSLGTISAPESQAALTKLAAQNDHPLRVSIAVAMHSADKSGTQDRFAKLFADEDVAIRREAATVVATLDEFDAVDLYVGALEDADSGVRKTSVIALSKIDTPAAQESLNAYLSPRVKEVMTVLAGTDSRKQSTTLHQISDLGPAAAPMLLEQLENANQRIRYSLASAIGRLHNPKVIPPVLEKLQNPKLDENSRPVYEMILRASGDQGRESIDELSEAKDPKVRVSGIRLLFGTKGDAASKTLKRALKDSSDEVRSYAAYALAIANDKDALPVLKELSKSKEMVVLRNSISGLSRLDDDTSLPILLKLADDASPAASGILVGAFGQFKEKQATDAIVSLTKTQPTLAYTAIYSLGRQSTPDAAKALGEFLKHDQTRIQQQARAALTRMRIPEARSILQQAGKEAKTTTPPPTTINDNRPVPSGAAALTELRQRRAKIEMDENGKPNTIMLAGNLSNRDLALIATQPTFTSITLSQPRLTNGKTPPKNITASGLSVLRSLSQLETLCLYNIVLDDDALPVIGRLSSLEVLRFVARAIAPR